MFRELGMDVSSDSANKEKQLEKRVEKEKQWKIT